MFNKIYGEWLEAPQRKACGREMHVLARCTSRASLCGRMARKLKRPPLRGPGSEMSVLDAALLLFEQAQVLA